MPTIAASSAVSYQQQKADRRLLTAESFDCYDDRLPSPKFHALARTIFQRYASGTVGAAR